MNKIAVVTGVSRLKGIGKAICIELAKQGIDIFFTYWTEYDKTMAWGVEENEPELILNEIKDLGVRCGKIELDLMNEESVRVLFNTVKDMLGQPSILINNATYSTQTNLSNITACEMDKHYMVNLKAPILLTSEFIKQYDNNLPAGRIVNLSSGQSLSFMDKEIAYAITKGAIDTFTRTVSQELASKNITINAVNPGLTDSGWLSNEQKDLFVNRFPMDRLGQPKDAAKLIAFLISDEASWITGQVIHSEGGFVRENFNS